MSAPLRLALIGTGRIGQVHAENIAASPDAELQWVCDAVAASAEAAGARFGARSTTESREAFLADDVDAVVIASPTPTHVDLIAAALDAGIPVLCEKPIDLDIARVDQLRERARSAGTPIAIGFNRRFDPHFAEVHRRVRAGEIGRLEHLAIISRDPSAPDPSYVRVSGGIFRDMTIHDFDMARFFVPEIVSVTAHGVNAFSAEIADAGDFDGAVVVLRGAGGEMVTITNSRRSAYGYDQRLEAVGADGLLRVGNINSTVVEHWGSDAVEARSPYLDFFLQRYADAYRAELAAFLALARGEESSCPSFEDGRAALILADAAAESAVTGRTVAVSVA